MHGSWPSSQPFLRRGVSHELTVARTAFDTALPLIASDHRRQGIRKNATTALPNCSFPTRQRRGGRPRSDRPGSWEDVGLARLAVLLLDRGLAAEAQAEVAEPLADTQRYFVNDLIWQPYALAIRADAARATGIWTPR